MAFGVLMGFLPVEVPPECTASRIEYQSRSRAHLQADPLGKLTAQELLKIYAALCPASHMRVKGHDKGSLIDRIHVLIGGMPEAQVFSAPTAGILIERLLHFERIG